MASRKTYPGHIERHGDQWRVTLSVNGTRHRLYLDGDMEEGDIQEAARTEYDRIRSQAQEGDVQGRTVRSSKLLDELEANILPTLAPGTQRSYRDSLKPIRDYFVDNGQDRRVDRIRSGHIRRYLNWRRRKRRGGQGPLSNRTLAKDRAVLSRLFAYAVKMEWVKGNPAATVEQPKSDGREYVILRRGEDGTSPAYENLLEECAKSSDQLHLYALILGETGVRCESEALWIEWNDIDLSGDPPAIWITGRRRDHRSKSGKGRWAPVSERLERALRDYMARYRFDGTDSPHLFHHLQDRRRAKRGDRVKSFRRPFDSAAQRAKLVAPSCAMTSGTAGSPPGSRKVSRSPSCRTRWGTRTSA